MSLRFEVIQAIPRGRHRRSRPNVKPFEEQPFLIDMAPTVLAALGAPATIQHTGRATVSFEEIAGGYGARITYTAECKTCEG